MREISAQDEELQVAGEDTVADVLNIVERELPPHPLEVVTAELGVRPVTKVPHVPHDVDSEYDSDDWISVTPPARNALARPAVVEPPSPIAKNPTPKPSPSGMQQGASGSGEGGPPARTGSVSSSGFDFSSVNQ